MDLVELFNDQTLTYEEKILEACEWYQLPTSNPDWVDQETNFMTFYLLTHLNSNEGYTPEDLTNILNQPFFVRRELKLDLLRQKIEELIETELEFTTLREAVTTMKDKNFPLDLMVDLIFTYSTISDVKNENTGFQMFILNNYQLLNLEDYLQYNKYF